MGMWDTLKASEKQHPVNVVNGDIKVVEDVNGKATVVTDTSPRGPSTRPKFRPVDPALADTRALIQERDAAKPPSDNFDLVGDDIGDDIGLPPSKRGIPGRPRLYPSDAAKQKAYRDRQKNG